MHQDSRPAHLLQAVVLQGVTRAAADACPVRVCRGCSLQVSGKTWKAPGVKAGSAKAAILGTSWEKKMADKRAKQLFNEAKQAAVSAAKEKRKVSHGPCCGQGYWS